MLESRSGGHEAMKLSGTFLVSLRDGIAERHHPNGSWVITREGEAWAQSIDQEDWSMDADSTVAARIATVESGDELEAASFTGRTGVAGTVVARAGRHLIIDGAAHGPSTRAHGPKGTVRFQTHTFDVRSHETYYSGSLTFLVGLRANHQLLEKIDNFFAPQGVEEVVYDEIVSGLVPMWA